MSDFVPTTEQVRQAYEVAHEEVGASYEPDEFDRWLASVERAAAARALEGAAEDMRLRGYDAAERILRARVAEIREGKSNE